MIATFLMGILLLMLGRKLFWLFVGVVGFVAGLHWGADLFAGQPPWVIWLLAVAMGLVGAILAVFLQRLAAGVAGFVTGAYLAAQLGALLGMQADALTAAKIVLGAICGILMMVMFDWVLIALSSLLGASLIADALLLHAETHAMVWLGLAAAGFALQAWQLMAGRPSAYAPPHEPVGTYR